MKCNAIHYSALESVGLPVQSGVVCCVVNEGVFELESVVVQCTGKYNVQCTTAVYSVVSSVRGV